MIPVPMTTKLKCEYSDQINMNLQVFVSYKSETSCSDYSEFIQNDTRKSIFKIHNKKLETLIPKCHSILEKSANN